MAAVFAVIGGAAMAQSIGSACGCPPVGSRTVVTLDNASSPALVAANGDLIPGAVNFTCDKLYILNDKVYVTNGKDLYIEPGTVIKAANLGGGANATALIVERGGQIWANGSESCPIIFTAQADPLDGSYAVTNRGQWGSLLILGRAYNNVRNADASVSVTGTDGVGVIEGLDPADSRHYYGMPVGQAINDDNSGVLRYVSLRHGGQVIGTANEINGLTLGSVGSGTTIDHVEVISNLDDGFEFFGGTVNAKYLVAQHCDDDYIDWDQGYSGRLQFVYGLQGPDNSGGALNQGDNGLELDADDNATNASNGGVPSTAQVWNATLIARTDDVAPADEGIEAKERTEGSVNNSIFVNFRSGLNLAGATGGSDAAAKWWNGLFNAKSNAFQGVTNPLRINGAGVSAGAEWTKFTTTDANAVVSGLLDGSYTTSPLNSNNLTDRVNPVPAAGAAGAATALKPAVSEPFLTAVQYRGAFEPGKAPWTQNWTLSAQIGSDVSAVAGCTGDLNRDGAVNATDFTLFVAAFNSTCY